MIRLVFEVAVRHASTGPTVLFTLPSVPLPDWAAGVVIGGPVTRRGPAHRRSRRRCRSPTIIACIGAANSLANPTRLLKAVPGALYEVGVAVVVGMTLAPQAVEDVRRVRQARRLRGRPTTGVAGMLARRAPRPRGRVRPLAAARRVDGRARLRPSRRRRRARRASLTAACTLGGLIGVLCGVYGLLDAGSPGWTGRAAAARRRCVVALRRHGARRPQRDAAAATAPTRGAARSGSTSLAGAVPAAVLVVCSARRA